jgi:hypothetical protein
MPPAVESGGGAGSVRIAGPRAVGRRGTLERVERHANPAVADGVELDLPATPVGLSDERVQLLRCPRWQPGAGVVLVRLQDRGRARVDHAVHEALEDAGVEVGAAAQRERPGLVSVEARAPLAERLLRLHDQRAAEPEGELAVRVDPPPERELVLGQPGVLRGGDAAGMQAGDRPAHGVAILVLRGLRHDAVDEGLRLLLERAGRRAVGVTDDQSRGRIGRLAVDAREAHRRRVGPSRVTVEAAHPRRPVRHDGVQEPRRRHGVRECGVEPAATEDPWGVRGRCRVRQDAVLDLLDRFERVEERAVRLAGAAAEVDVRVVEARHQEAAVRVDDLAGSGRDLASADRLDGPARDGEGRRARPAEHPGVDDGELGRHRPILRARRG